jgi:hypothetical protein
LARAGVRVCKRSVLRGSAGGVALVEDRFTGALTRVPAAVVVDAGPSLPETSLAPATADAAGTVHLAGDAVAPRVIAEAVLEGRRAALAVGQR